MSELRLVSQEQLEKLQAKLARYREALMKVDGMLVRFPDVGINDIRVLIKQALLEE